MMNKCTKLVIVFVVLLGLQLANSGLAEASFSRTPRTPQPSDCPPGGFCGGDALLANITNNFTGHDWGTIVDSVTGQRQLILSTYDVRGNEIDVLNFGNFSFLTGTINAFYVGGTGLDLESQQALFNIISEPNLTTDLLSFDRLNLYPIGNNAYTGSLVFPYRDTYKPIYLAAPAAPVPEPSTVFLLGAGLIGLVLIKIRRRREE